MEVRVLHALEEFEQAVELQRIVWGFADLEILPRRMFVVTDKIGGQSIGAFDDGKMIGFSIAIPALKAGGGAFLHSNMMGVLKEYRNAGVGRMLKLKQREVALLEGIELIEWTFDPLEVKNAFFNIERLGVVIRRFVLNQYGVTTSHLHGSLPTDRCTAEWWLNSPRVNGLFAYAPVVYPPPSARISVPNDIADIKASDPAKAREVQKAVSEQFLEHLGSGLAVTGFERGDDAGTYLLTPWHSN